MTLIERGLKQSMSAEVTVDFNPEGVKATLRAPLLVGSPGDPSPSADM